MQKKPAGIFKDSMEAEVLNLSGKPEDVENFLAELNTSQSQLLWKKFELSRQRDGVTKDYEHAVAGTGTLQKKRACLRAWMLGQMSCKSSEYIEAQQSMAVSKRHIAEAEWMSLKKALDVYGPKELKQRVHAGSIQTRSSPSDSRFPEFKVLSEKDLSLIHI